MSHSPSHWSQYSIIQKKKKFKNWGSNQTPGFWGICFTTANASPTIHRKTRISHMFPKWLGLSCGGLRFKSYEKWANKGFHIRSISSLLQCPPFRLSYQGLGEPLCFAAFGPFASTAFYLLQGSTRLFDLYNHRPYLYIFVLHSYNNDFRWFWQSDELSSLKWYNSFCFNPCWLHNIPNSFL